MSKTKLSSSDYLLLLLDLDNQKPIIGAIRLMKMMFLFEKEIMPVISQKDIEVTVKPAFIAYDFGPFSKDIYEQIEFFNNLEFIRTDKVDAKDSTDELDDWEELYSEDVLDQEIKNGYRKLEIDYKSVRYTIRDRGHRYVQLKILPEVSEEVICVLLEFKKKINSISTRQLLYYVYSRYEEYTTESKIKDKVLGELPIMPDESELEKPYDDNESN